MLFDFTFNGSDISKRMLSEIHSEDAYDIHYSNRLWFLVQAQDLGRFSARIIIRLCPLPEPPLGYRRAQLRGQLSGMLSIM